MAFVKLMPCWLDQPHASSYAENMKYWIATLQYSGIGIFVGSIIASKF